MAENTEISWCDHTANLWWGCTEVHEGCDNCYARNLAHRWGFEVWGAKGVRRVIKGFWKDLARYQRKAAEAGAIRSVFVGSMMDIFEKPMPMVNDDGTPYTGEESNPFQISTENRRKVLFDNITEGKYPNLVFLFLTKRPSNINKYIPDGWKEKGAPANVMFGTSVVNQETADKLIPQLLEVKGRRFLSMEPLLGPVSLEKIWVECPMCEGSQSIPVEGGGNACPKCLEPYQGVVSGIDWVIVGGESGQKARPMHPDWARSLRDECLQGKIKFHFKQWGEWAPIRAAGLFRDLQRVDFTDNSAMGKVGKKTAGRELDGKEYNALPFL